MRLCGRNTSRPTQRRIPAASIVVALSPLLLSYSPSPAQLAAFQGPVATLDDSVLAREGLPRIRELANGGNYPEALRILQNLLDNDAEKVIESSKDPNLHTTVRRHAQELLLADPVLLQRYRDQEDARAREMLDRGDLSGVETTRFLTRSGITAAARLAQTQLDLGRFEAARLTLEQLSIHPDRANAPDAIGTAARVASSLAALLPRADTRSLATALRSLAQAQGLTIPAAAPSPLPKGIAVLTPLVPAPPFDPEKVAPVALRSMPLDNPVAKDTEDFGGFQRGGNPRKEEPIVFPAAAGNLLLVNDGTQVTALDRDTFSPRWSITPGDQMDIVPHISDDPFALYLSGRTIEDPPSVICSAFPAANVVVATTGIARNGRRNGDGRVHGIEADTGRVLWSTEPQVLSPSLLGGSLRGPASIEGDTVVLSVRKQGQGGRDTAAVLIGLDLYSGSLRWTRSLGVVGRLPWQVSQRRSDALTIREGVVYYADEIGVAGAVEASTGRPIWVRRMPTGGSPNARNLGRGDTLPPHSTHLPILVGSDLFLLEAGDPEHQRIVRLDAATGELKDSRDASAFGTPHYLVRVGDSLAAIGAKSAGLVKLSDFANSTIHVTAPLVAPGTTGDGSIIGRALAAGNHLLLPLQGALAIIERPEDPTAVRFVPIEGSGNILVADGSLLAADLSTLRSFIRWEEASTMLKARIANDPGSIDAMLALVDLSLRAGKPAEAVPVASKALDALDLADASGTDPSAPSLATPSASRRRLFDTLLPIIAPRQDASRTDQDKGRAEAAPVPVSVQDALIASLDRAAEEPRERATFLIALGELRAQRRDEVHAIEAYQSILGDDRLARVEPLAIAGATPGRSAGHEATVRLINLVTHQGFNVYAAFADEAARTAAAFTGNESAEDIARLAARYPLAPASIDLWTRAGELFTQTNHPTEAIRAFGHALSTADTLVLSGRMEEFEAQGRLGLRLAQALENSGLNSSAYRVLSRLLRDSPMAIALAGTSPSDVEEHRDRLRHSIDQSEGAPKIGWHIAGKAPPAPASTTPLEPIPPQPLTGWRPSEVLLGPGEGAPTDCIAMISPTTGEIGLFILRPEIGDLAQAWTRSYQPFAPTVLRIDLDTTYLFWPGSRGGSVEAIDNADGSTLWKTGEFASLFQGEPKRPVGDRFQVPVTGDVRAADLVVSMDDDTLLLVERGGRAAAFDLHSGTSLWANPTILTRVFDVAGTGDLLLAAGVVDQGDRDVGPPPPPVIIAINKRTGNPGPSIDLTSGESAKLTPDEHVRWMRADAKGRVVVSLANGLACIDAPTGRTLWDQRQNAITGPALRASVAGLVAGDKILVLDGDRHLYMVPLATGETRGGLLATEKEKQSKLELPIRLSQRENRILLTGTKGMLAYDLSGQLAGADALDPSLILATPTVAASVVVTIAQQQAFVQPLPGRVLPQSEDSFELFFFDTDSARLVGREELLVMEEPSDLATIDGKLLITAGSITFVLDAPHEPHPTLPKTSSPAP